MRLPNLLHETVPVGQGENDNVQVRTSGKIPKFDFPPKNHIDLGLNLDIIDMERAGKVAGSRFFYLKREAVLLDMALMSFAIEEMTKKGYISNRTTLLDETRTIRRRNRTKRLRRNALQNRKRRPIPNRDYRNIPWQQCSRTKY